MSDLLANEDLELRRYRLWSRFGRSTVVASVDAVQHKACDEPLEEQMETDHLRCRPCEEVIGMGERASGKIQRAVCGACVNNPTNNTNPNPNQRPRNTRREGGSRRRGIGGKGCGGGLGGGTVRASGISGKGCGGGLGGGTVRARGGIGGWLVRLARVVHHREAQAFCRM